MPRFYLASAWTRSTWNVTHEGDIFRVEADPLDAAGPAMHLSLSREDAERLHVALGQALQDADAGEAAKWFGNATEQRLDAITAHDAAETEGAALHLADDYNRDATRVP